MRKTFLITLIALIALNAKADSGQTESSIQFHQLLKEALGTNDKVADQAHVLLPAAIDQSLMRARTIGEAIEIARPLTLETLAKESSRFQAQQRASLEDALHRNPITIIVVPGIFSEFIKTRAFEAAFSKPTAFSRKFHAQASNAEVRRQAAAFDQTFDGSQMKQVRARLQDLLSVASLDDENGQPLAKVVLFNTPLLSLESVASVDHQAAIFTRRLEKYLALTGPQTIALVGYSRGLTTALQMVSKAQQLKSPWLSSVKAVVSYGGVVSGSSLADPIDNPNTPLSKALTALKDLRNTLQVTDDSTGFSLTRSFNNFRIHRANDAAWVKFVAIAATLAPKLASSGDAPDTNELEGAPAGVDLGQPLSMALSMFKELGLEHPVAGYSQNIQRFQMFVDANITAISQLRTSACLSWWKSHTIPTQGITYYSLAASMADPSRSAFEKSLFYGSTLYSQSFDDKSLLKNHRDYLEATGLRLNDSQVGVPQAMFLPEVIRQLNPAQAPLKIANLGVVMTHHWGLALQVVSPMKNKKLNPFPREAVLKAIAGQIALDL